MHARRNSTPPPDSDTARIRQGRGFLSDRQWQLIAKTLTLSKRELQTLLCILDNKTETAIARELGISGHTVHTHIERLYRKLGVDCRCAAVVRVFAEYVALEEGRAYASLMPSDSSGPQPSPPAGGPSHHHRLSN